MDTDAMWGTADESILTRSQVAAWISRRAEITREIEALHAEAKTIDQKLDAVKVLVGPLSEVPEAGSAPPDQSDVDAGGDVRFPEAVLTAVRELGGAPRPADIRAWLRDYAASEGHRFQAMKPYFYAVLMRHAAAGRLIKVGEGYSLPKGSP